MNGTVWFGGDDSDYAVRRYFRDIESSTPLSREREVELSARIKEGDMAARDELISANLRFVIDVARQYQNRGLSLADLIGAGNVGLMTAADRFDGTRGFKFISYAVWWIQQAIKQAIAEQARAVRLPISRQTLLRDIFKASRNLGGDDGNDIPPEDIAEALGISAGEVRQALLDGRRVFSLDVGVDGDESWTLLNSLRANGPAPDEGVMQRAGIDLLNRLIGGLDEREREIIWLYFGLDGAKALTLEQIGERMSLTRERIRQLKEQALGKLRHPNRADRIRQHADPDAVERAAAHPAHQRRSRAKSGNGSSPASSSQAGKKKPPAKSNGSAGTTAALQNGEVTLAQAEKLFAKMRAFKETHGRSPTLAEASLYFTQGRISPEELGEIVQKYRRQAATP